jgi:hypothetical protein
MNIGLKRRVPDRDRNQEVAPTGRRAGFESDLNYRVCVSLQMKVVTLPGWKPFGLAGGASSGITSLQFGICPCPQKKELRLVPRQARGRQHHRALFRVLVQDQKPSR